MSAIEAANRRVLAAEGLLLTLEDSSAPKGMAVASADALLKAGDRKVRVSLDSITDPDPEVVEAAACGLRKRLAEDRVLLEGAAALGEAVVSERALSNQGNAKRAQAVKQAKAKPKPKGRSGKGVKDPEYEKKHPRAPKGRVGGGQWIKKGAGMEGKPDQKVDDLQTRLQELGYKLDKDGRFGDQTEAAVKKFQKDRGIEQTGEIDAKTTAELRRNEGDAKEEAESEGRELSTDKDGKGRGGGGRDSEGGKGKGGGGGRGSSGGRDGGGGGGSAVLAQGEGMEGSASPAVKKLQRELEDFGFDLGSAGVDGRFGPQTKAAVRKFQKKYGLKIDGKVGKKTLKAMLRVAKRRAKREQDPISADEESFSEHAKSKRRKQTEKWSRKTEKTGEKGGDRMVQEGERKDSDVVVQEAVVFDPNLHPRDRLGKFMEVLRGLKPGEVARMKTPGSAPDIKVKKIAKPDGRTRWQVDAPGMARPDFQDNPGESGVRQAAKTAVMHRERRESAGRRATSRGAVNVSDDPQAQRATEALSKRQAELSRMGIRGEAQEKDPMVKRARAALDRASAPKGDTPQKPLRPAATPQKSKPQRKKSKKTQMKEQVARVEAQPNPGGTFASIQQWKDAPMREKLDYERARSEALAATGLPTFDEKFEALLKAKDKLFDARSAARSGDKGDEGTGNPAQSAMQEMIDATQERDALEFARRSLIADRDAGKRSSLTETPGERLARMREELEKGRVKDYSLARQRGNWGPPPKRDMTPAERESHAQVIADLERQIERGAEEHARLSRIWARQVEAVGGGDLDEIRARLKVANERVKKAKARLKDFGTRGQMRLALDEALADVDEPLRKAVLAEFLSDEREMVEAHRRGDVEEYVRLRARLEVEEGAGAAGAIALGTAMRGGGSSLRGGHSVKFDPNLHPRDREGKFMEVLNRLVRQMQKSASETHVSATASLELPSGVKVKVTDGVLGQKLQVVDRTGKKKTVRSFTSDSKKWRGQYEEIAKAALNAHLPGKKGEGRLEDENTVPGGVRTSEYRPGGRDKGLAAQKDAGPKPFRPKGAPKPQMRAATTRQERREQRKRQRAEEKEAKRFQKVWDDVAEERRKAKEEAARPYRRPLFPGGGRFSGGTTTALASIQMAADTNEKGHKVQEAEQFTKPGTANVSPSDMKKLSGLLKHYAKKPHPFTSCYRDQIKHGLSKDHAARRCAVLKDLIRGTTKWRKGGKKVSEAIDAWAEEAVGILLEAETDPKGLISYLEGQLALQEAESKASGKPWEKSDGGKADKMQGGGSMKRCHSCNWKNPMGSTKCKKCHANLKAAGDPKDKRKVSEAMVEAHRRGDTDEYLRLRARLEVLEPLDEGLMRGGSRKARVELKRLPNGEFAPLGQGTVLRRGDRVTVPHRDGKGMVKGEVTTAYNGHRSASVVLDRGPDKGKAFHVNRDDDSGESKRKREQFDREDDATDEAKRGEYGRKQEKKRLKRVRKGERKEKAAGAALAVLEPRRSHRIRQAEKAKKREGKGS